MSQRLKTDWILFGAVVSMVAFGLLMLYSASSVNAQMDPKFHSSWHFVVRQLGWAAASAAAMIDPRRRVVSSRVASNRVAPTLPNASPTSAASAGSAPAASTRIGSTSATSTRDAR